MREHHIRRRVEFFDTDAFGSVHFGRLFVFMEIAEHDFLRSLGVGPGASEPDAEGHRAFLWPRVSVSCDYLAPARYGDELDVHLAVERMGASSLTYAFDIRCSGTPVARGRMTTVHCVAVGDGMKAVPLSPEIVARIEATEP
jgi:acyl-CoA thioester hydrolase